MGEDRAAISCKARGNLKEGTLTYTKKPGPGREAKLTTSIGHVQSERLEHAAGCSRSQGPTAQAGT